MRPTKLPLPINPLVQASDTCLFYLQVEKFFLQLLNPGFLPHVSLPRLGDIVLSFISMAFFFSSLFGQKAFHLDS